VLALEVDGGVVVVEDDKISDMALGVRMPGVVSEVGQYICILRN
jgi:hypothetical protein